MTPDDIDRAVAVDDSALPGVPPSDKNRPFIVRENDGRSREGALIDDEVALVSREKSATQREESAHLRERDMHTIKTTQTASDDQVMMLQQVNAHLVVATLEAQQLTEQLQTTKVELDNSLDVPSSVQANLGYTASKSLRF